MPGKYFDQIRKVSGKGRNICLIQLETDFRDRHKDPKTVLLRNLDRTAQRLCTVTDIGQSHTTGSIFGLIAV